MRCEGEAAVSRVAERSGGREEALRELRRLTGRRLRCGLGRAWL